MTKALCLLLSFILIFSGATPLAASQSHGNLALPSAIADISSDRELGVFWEDNSLIRTENKSIDIFVEPEIITSDAQITLDEIVSPRTRTALQYHIAVDLPTASTTSAALSLELEGISPDDIIIVLEEGTPALDDAETFGIAPRAPIVNIVYRSIGHTGGTVPAVQSFLTPGSATLRPQGALVRTGHTFVGWRDSAGSIFAPGAVVSFSTAVAGTITLYAHWVANIVTVTYHSSGHTSGTVPLGQVVNTPGSFVAREPGSLTRTGHAFYGWRMPHGTIVLPGTIISVTGHGTVRMDAVWVPSIVTFQYRGNGHTGGTVPASHQLLTPGTTTLRQPGNMTRTGHTFSGWRDQFGTTIAAGANIVLQHAVAGTITFDAVWSINRVVVTYNGNGHTGGTVPVGHTVNTPGSFLVRSPGNMVRNGYVFGGWRDAASGFVFQPGDTINLTGSGSMQLNAIWTRVSPVVWWRVFNEDVSRSQFRVTVERSAEFYGHRNVYIGVYRLGNSRTEDVFISSDGINWSFIGFAHVTSNARFDTSVNEWADMGYPDLTEYLTAITPDPNARVASNILVQNPFYYAVLTNLISRAIENTVRRLGGADDFTITFFIALVEELIRIAGVNAQFRELAVRTLEDAVDQMMLDLRNGTANFAGFSLMRTFQLLHMTRPYTAVSIAAVENRYSLNRMQNQTIINNGIIHCQRTEPQGTLRIGPLGNGAQHGCGPFAVYNALFHLSNENNRPSPAGIIRGIDMSGGFNIGGSLGTNPEAVLDSLRMHSNRSTNIQYLPITLSSSIRNSSASVLLYVGDIWTGYVHYVMVRHDGNGYHIYNYAYRGTSATRTSSIYSWIGINPAIALITIN